jgi:glycosyltransferase involved in cell wall biosynthesis
MQISTAAGMGWPPWRELRDRIEADEMSDALALHDRLGITVLDTRYLDGLSGRWGRLLRRLPYRAAQAIEMLRRRGQYDAIFTWGEVNAVFVAALLLVVRRRPAHLCVLFAPAKPKKALPLLVLQRGIDRMIIPSPLQRRKAVATFHLPRHKTVELPWNVDTRFWRPMPETPEEDLTCSAGIEMRDYPTLIRALQPLDIRCHIAAAPANRQPAWKDPFDGMALPAHITEGPKSEVELRDLYARSRFVVVPLLPSDTDNGITTCLEAMAMGKAVICTDTEGQIGVLEDGVNAIRVPPQDPLALRAAIQRLRDDPDLRARLGAAGRRTVETRYATSVVVPRFAAVFKAAAERRAAARHGAPVSA